MELKTQKRIAADVLKCSKKRVTFDTDRLDDIKEAITKRDIRLLVNEGAISKKPIKSISRVRANKIKTQKSKGRMKGMGSKKGKAGARTRRKTTWINKIRLQRKFLQTLREKDFIESSAFRKLYKKASSGFFRSKKHLKMYVEENNLINNKK